MRDPRDRAYRERKAHLQHRRCYYRDFPMWSRRPDGFARHYGITIEQVANFQCTAEHLLARCDGGTSRLDNIVAACRCCNLRRHLRASATDPEHYRALVRKRVAKLAWHGRGLHKMLGKRHSIPAS